MLSYPSRLNSVRGYMPSLGGGEPTDLMQNTWAPSVTTATTTKELLQQAKAEFTTDDTDHGTDASPTKQALYKYPRFAHAPCDLIQQRMIAIHTHAREARRVPTQANLSQTAALDKRKGVKGIPGLRILHVFCGWWMGSLSPPPSLRRISLLPTAVGVWWRRPPSAGTPHAMHPHHSMAGGRCWRRTCDEVL